MTTTDEWSLNVVVKKHPNVSAANTVSVNANMVLALAKKVFIFRLFNQIKYKHQQQSTFDTIISGNSCCVEYILADVTSSLGLCQSTFLMLDY